MKSGFYDISKLDDKELKQFFTDAHNLSYDSRVDKLDSTSSWRRQNTDDYSVQEMIDNCKVKHHNVCIDRSIQYSPTDYGEIGYCTIADDPDYFLWIYVTLDNLKILTDKYNLEMR